VNGRQRVDLGIRSGTVVPASGCYEAALGVRGGRVMQIGGDFSAD
jgi:urease alpha subunit